MKQAKRKTNKIPFQDQLEFGLNVIGLVLIVGLFVGALYIVRGLL